MYVKNHDYSRSCPNFSNVASEIKATRIRNIAPLSESALREYFEHMVRAYLSAVGGQGLKSLFPEEIQHRWIPQWGNHHDPLLQESFTARKWSASSLHESPTVRKSLIFWLEESYTAMKPLFLYYRTVPQPGKVSICLLQEAPTVSKWLISLYC